MLRPISVFVALVVLQLSANGEIVNCSIPYETDCISILEETGACFDHICESSSDPDQILPVCGESYTPTETEVYGDLLNNPLQSHLGLLPLDEIGVVGHEYFTLGSITCGRSRTCQTGDTCQVSGGAFRCQSQPIIVLWNDITDDFYEGVEGTECEILEW